MSTHPRPKTSSLRIAALAVLLGLGGCMTPTPYAPRVQGTDTGYTDLALTQNRYRVTFTGNSATPRETVESYLLLRAAEVARAAGYESFVFDTRNTDATTRLQTTPGFGGYGGYGYGGYGGNGRRSGFSFGTGFGFGGGGYRSGFGYGSGFGFPYDPGMDIVARTNFQAYAEIVLLTPEQAARETRAMKASEVLERMGPQTVRTNTRNAT